MKSNTLTVYLIKEEYTDFEQVIEQEDGKKPQCSSVSIGNDVTSELYYFNSHTYPPEWLGTFFGDALEEEVVNSIFASNVQAVLLLRIETTDGLRVFALAFGTGRFLLRDSAVDKRFGLRTVLNLLEADKIRHVDKKEISSNPKHTREQIAKPGQTAEFGIDIERDILNGITGTSSEREFGTSITGSSAFKTSVKQDVNTISDWLTELYKHFKSERYKSSFSWVDMVAEVRDKSLIEHLDSTLIEVINSGEREEVWLAIPEIIEWEKVEGCKYSQRKKDEFVPGDIDLAEFLAVNFAEGTTVDLDFFKDTYITAQDSENKIIYRWTAYQCLVAELATDGLLYVLSDGTWYSIEENFHKKVEDFFAGEIAASGLTWVEYKSQNEEQYNTELAASLDAACLDKKNVSYGGGHSRIEVCDVLTSNKQLIHVKKYGGSAPLSHLFSQGYVSAQALASDIGFREDAREKIERGKKPYLSPTGFKPSEWTVVFGILGKKRPKLPFFSKVTLKHVTQNLLGRGYSVNLDFIAQIES